MNQIYLNAFDFKVGNLGLEYLKDLTIHVENNLSIEEYHQGEHGILNITCDAFQYIKNEPPKWNDIVSMNQ